MPTRFVWDKACRSADLALLTGDEERLFWRLLTQADDFGRFDARPEIVRAQCFPLQTDTIGVNDTGTWLNRLQTVGLVTFYLPHHGEFNAWEKYQRRRASTSKFPDPRALAGTRGHSSSDVDNGNSRALAGTRRQIPPYSVFDFRFSYSMFDVKASADAPKSEEDVKRPQVSEDEHYLLERLHSIDGWGSLTYGAIVRLNGTYSRQTTTEALRRAWEEGESPKGSAYGLVEAMCRDIAAKGGTAVG